ncbi:peptidoglycan DD-metalloendopeptidase family protein [Caldanaerobacter subterraneus]|uniref:peptidoglycan DD-metalloendopeptidase family protein n=1 Tax=Caldanaerobacter subterraneus TaxID=911092 RepID=UPI00346394D6
MRINRENFLRFFDRKGFYIVLFLSIVVIAATAVYVTDSNLKKLEEIRKAQQEEINSAVESNLNYDYEEEMKRAKEEKPAVGQDFNVAQKEPEKKEAEPEAKSEQIKTKEVFSTEAKKLTVTPSPAKTDKKTSISTRLVLLRPLEGKVVMEFAKDKLVYSKTLNEWTTHKGIDIAGKLGEPVVAASDGIVSKVYKDPKLGNTVVIKNGIWEMVYASLGDNIKVKEGDKITKGQQIGEVGDTAKFEIAEGPHLHFELRENEVPIDPTPYFGE